MMTIWMWRLLYALVACIVAYAGYLIGGSLFGKKEEEPAVLADCECDCDGDCRCGTEFTGQCFCGKDDDNKNAGA